MTSDELKTAATGFLPGVVVGAVIVWLAMSAAPTPVVPITLPSDTNDESTQQSDTSSPSDTPSTPTDVTIEVSDQPAGRAVIVKSAVVSKTSWIAVRDLNDGKIGNVLGAVRRDAGNSRDIVIDLLRATEPGKQYAVVVFADDGDGSFSTKTDAPVMIGDAPYMATLKVTTPVAPNGR